MDKQQSPAAGCLAYISPVIEFAEPGEKLRTFVDQVRVVGILLKKGRFNSDYEMVKRELWGIAQANGLTDEPDSFSEAIVEYEIDKATAIDDEPRTTNGHDDEPPPLSEIPESAGADPDHAPPRIEITSLPPLTINDWIARDLPQPDFLSGHWLTTTSRVLLSATTGLGKSNLGIALGMRIAAGVNFLHWDNERAAKVLFIDGEMSRRLLRQRIIDEAGRVGQKPGNFHALSSEDIPDFKALNTTEGQLWISALIRRLGGIDLIIFDNIMSLISGDMKDEEPWQQTLPWVRWLTRQAVGQIWIHHTGHDETRSYGTKTREWQMDTVIHLDVVKRDETDISFCLQFKKARERTPATRFDFQDVKIALIDDRWEYELTDTRRPGKVPPQTEKALDALMNVLAGDQVVMLPGSRRAAHPDHWAAECNARGLIDIKRKEKSATTIFNRFRRELVAANRIACDGDLQWLLR
jgi:hypothetical protein